MTMAGGAFFSVSAGEYRFFRVVGPTSSVIKAFGGDGTLVWSSAVTRATCTVQRACALGVATNWQDYVQVACTSRTTTSRLFDPNAPTGMVLVPAGIFSMGDNLEEGWYLEWPVHTVYVSGFYMDKTGVTLAQWQAVRDWSITNGYDLADIGAGKAADHPVYDVNWYDCVKWCNARSQQEGLTPCYTWSGSVYTNGECDDIVCSWSARLASRLDGVSPFSRTLGFRSVRTAEY